MNLPNINKTLTISGSLLKMWVTEFEKFAVGYRYFVYLSKCSLVKPHLQLPGRYRPFLSESKNPNII